MAFSGVLRRDTMSKNATDAVGYDAAAVSAAEDEDGARVFHHDAKIVVAEKHDAKFVYRTSSYMIDPRDPFMRKWRGRPAPVTHVVHAALPHAYRVEATICLSRISNTYAK